MAALIAVAGCGGSSGGSAADRSTTTATASPPAARTAAGLRAAALAWSQAFLTGSPSAILSMEGPECRPGGTTTTFDQKTVDAYLKTEREAMRRHFGVALDEIKNHGVEVRNFTTAGGEARVRYDLPESVTGNDNWVEFAWHGSWQVADCRAPIGGSSSSSSSSATTPATPARHG